MKLIKFIAAASLVASTFLVSGGNAAPDTVVAPQIAACTDWPFCRDVEIKDETSEPHFVAACTDWPFCRDVEVTEQVLPQQLNTATVRKAV